MKFTKISKKLFFTIAISVATIVAGATVLQHQQIKQTSTIKKSVLPRLDPVQAKMLNDLQRGQGEIVKYASSTALPPDKRFINFQGEDIANIGNANITSSDESTFYQSEKPATGIVIVNTNVTSADGAIKANAYDFVNLRYVFYDLDKGQVTTVKDAPPFGLFKDNNWPSLSDTNNNLASFFPTLTIRDEIKKTFGFTDTFTKAQWFDLTNKSPITLNLSGLSLISIAEIFNPNLIWGFGIYDLTNPVVSILKTGESVYGNNEIYYKGLYSINVDDNLLKYFPNPHFNNMPALKHISAKGNEIQAIGDFASYQRGSLTATTSSASTVDSYFLYLKSLWTNSEFNKYAPVKAIQKWLTQVLPSFSKRTTNKVEDGFPTAARGTPNNQQQFLTAISANDVYLMADDGSVFTKNSDPEVAKLYPPPYGPSGRGAPDANGNWSDLNFSQVLLNLSKSIYSLDFSHNEIERLPVIKTRLTNVDFSFNKLRFLPPLALQPLPWNYFAVAMTKGQRVFAAYLNFWNQGYFNDTDKRLERGVGSTRVDFNVEITLAPIAPKFAFSGNQILDWWPQQDDVNQWYAWPNTHTVAAKSAPPVAKTITSTSAQAPSPYNRNTLGESFNGYLHRNYITAGVTDVKTPFPAGGYVESTANLLGNWNHRVGLYKDNVTTWAQASNEFYTQVFSNLWDNQAVIGTQNFETTINYVVGKNKPFVLPGYSATDTKSISVDTFNDNLFQKTGQKYDSMAYLSYNSLVPYLFGRTIPQSYTTAGTWKGKKVKVELIDAQGNNVLGNAWNNLDMETLFNNLESGQSATRSNENSFINQVIGSLPFQVKNSSLSNNQPQGIPVSSFKDHGDRLTLKISQPDINWNFEYNINVLRDIAYTITPKNPGTGNSTENPVENIGASTFSKKDFIATQITAGDLMGEIDSWANLSDYVKLYLQATNGLKIVSQDAAKAEVVVSFSLRNTSNEVVNVPNFTLKNFSALRGTFVDNDGNLISGTNLDDASDVFLPSSQAEVKNWIESRYVVNWLGLELKNPVPGGLTATNGPVLDPSGPNAELHKKGFYKLNELKEDYLGSIAFSKNLGTLSFAINIPGTPINSNVALVENYTINSFRTANFQLNTTAIDYKNGAFEFIKSPTVLKKLIELTPTRKLADGSVQNIEPTPWNNLSNDELIAQNLIPAQTKLSFDNLQPQANNGILNFNVKLEDLATTPATLIAIKNYTIDTLSTFNSRFSYGVKANAKSGIAFASDSAKSTLTPSTLVTNVKALIATPSNFNDWIKPLINFNNSAPSWTSPTGSEHPKINGTTSLTEDQIKQLKFGFNSTVSFDDSSISNNLIAFDQSMVLGINNLYVKGGYLNGTFYAGSDTDAPVYRLGNLLVSFAKTITTPITPIKSSFITSNETRMWDGTTYVGFNQYYKKGLEHWKSLLPSEWKTQLAFLKANNTSNTVNNETFSLDKYDSLFSFLNHVLNTPTSNNQFKTRVDVVNPNLIEVNDFNGIVTIPANTLTIYNMYTNTSEAVSNPMPTPYGETISFRIADYLTKLTTEEKGRLPWATNEVVSSNFRSAEIKNVKATLEGLLSDAKGFYEANDTTPNDVLDKGRNAITILVNNFIADFYYGQPIADNFFTDKFTTANSEPDKAGQYTEFSNITFSKEDDLLGTMEITVTLKNYISGFNYANNKYQLKDTTRTFSLRGLLRNFITPVWLNGENETVNLSQTTKGFVFPPNSETSETFSRVNLFKEDFHNYNPEGFYDHLLKNNLSADGQYLKLDAKGLGVAGWEMVNNFGVRTDNQDNINEFVKKLEHLFIAVRKEDVFVDPTCGCIYLINPVLHLDIANPTTEQKNDALANIFDPKRNLLDYEPFDANNNFYTQSLPNATLTGFLKNVTKVQLKSNIQTINMNGKNFAPNQVLPSDIYDFILKNYNDRSIVNNFLESFFTVSGTSMRNQPIQLGFSSEAMNFLDDSNPATGANGFLRFNDGLGTFDFLKVIYITNTFQTPQQTTPNSTPLPVTDFMDVPVNNLSLTKLKSTSSGEVTSNSGVNSLLSSNITTAVAELEKNDYALAKRILVYQGIRTNVDNDQSKLEINGLDVNLTDGEIFINYTIQNKYHNGLKMNATGVYVLSGLFSGWTRFLKFGLAPVLIILVAILISIYYIHIRYRKWATTKKYTKKQIKNKL